jgi:serine/threonine-protein phosphatase 5
MPAYAPLRLPDAQLDSGFLRRLIGALKAQCQAQAQATPSTPSVLALTLRDTLEILRRACVVLAAERNVVRVPSQQSVVHVVGDLHGQFCDLVRLCGSMQPGGAAIVFAGDYVDRGPHGAECVILLLALKVAHPRSVFLLRGNHETAACATAYGFAEEVTAKYGATALKDFYAVFAAMPLAALIRGDTLVVHGGLWESPTASSSPGTIEELDAACRTEQNPTDPVVVAALWSDPAKSGMARFNERRKRGLVFGPEFTSQFMARNGLRLVIRAHEGPEARKARPDMPDMTAGYCIDHCVDAGLLVTIFSAPNSLYCGAYATLRSPNYAIEFTQFQGTASTTASTTALKRSGSPVVGQVQF